MVEATPPVQVQKLTSLVLVIDGKKYALSVRKPSGQSVSDFMRETREEFKRRFIAGTSRTYNSVEGSMDLEEATVDKIFDTLFLIPYENEENWIMPLHGLAGLIVVKPPRGGEDTRPTTSTRQASGKRQQRKMAQVTLINAQSIG